ncbi:MAG TPA: oligosaccharide flippase family protein [Gaiellaceae bacterium]|nr:oligosaccharide flippase family protein [Gaiellaceae bacterium]
MTQTLLWRRGVAAVGMYGGAALGFLATIVAARELATKGEFARYAIVMAAVGLLQLIFDITAEEAAVKYGYRYRKAGDWGRFRRLFRVMLGVKAAGGALGAVAVVCAAALSHAIYGKSGLVVPMLVAALIPLLQAPEGMAAAMLLVRGRYDLRGAFLAVSMGLRLAAIAFGAPHGVVTMLAAIVAAQGFATGAILAAGLVSLGRFPRAAPTPLGADGGPLRRFVFHSTLGSALVSLRTTLPTNIVGGIMPSRAVADFRTAQAPQTALASLSAPARMILMSEQSRHVEAGRLDRVYAGIRRYMLGTGALMAVFVPLAWWGMPWFVRVTVHAKYLSAVDAARLILLTGAIQIVWGWTRPFAVSIGRPGLRALTYVAELVVLVPAVLVLGHRWGATGAAGGVLAGSVAFALLWSVLLVRLRGQPVESAARRSAEALS